MFFHCFVYTPCEKFRMGLCVCANLRARATNLLWQNNVFCSALRCASGKKKHRNNISRATHEVSQSIYIGLRIEYESYQAACTASTPHKQNRKFNLNFIFFFSYPISIFHNLFFILLLTIDALSLFLSFSFSSYLSPFLSLMSFGNVVLLLSHWNTYNWAFKCISNIIDIVCHPHNIVIDWIWVQNPKFEIMKKFRLKLITLTFRRPILEITFAHLYWKQKHRKVKNQITAIQLVSNWVFNYYYWRIHWNQNQIWVQNVHVLTRHRQRPFLLWFFPHTHTNSKKYSMRIILEFVCESRSWFVKTR